MLTSNEVLTADTPLVEESESEATLRRQPVGNIATATEECCLVQIYPPDVVNGMLLIKEDQIVLGRDEACDLVLPDASVSRRHAILYRSGPNFHVVDQDSTNGTLINGQETANQPLRSGDTIQLGSFIFKFLFADSVESQYHETVYSAMTQDALTGAMNKRYLLEVLSREISRAGRHQAPLAVVMMDIDHFKSVNDTHGHLVGDEVLREFGHRLQATSRDDDLFARYGGEEFVLVLAATQRAEALDMAERCRLAIADQPFNAAVGPLPITASFGVALMPNDQDGMSPENLIGLADERLYAAKNGGRNQVVG